MFGSLERRYTIWICEMFTVLFAVITIVSLINSSYSAPLTIVKVAIAAIIPAILPLYEIIFKRKTSIFINVLIASHAVLSVFLGSGFAFYSRIAWWDLFLHGYFGFVGSAVLLMIFYGLGGKIKMFGLCVFIFLSVMGCAALWEAFEFTTDIIFTQDAQGVYESTAHGLNPIRDTMTDILITAAGTVIFLAAAVLSQFIRKKREKSPKT